MCRLRLVCSIFNELLKNRVSERLVLSDDRFTQVEEMVSGPNVFNAACQILRLEGHYDQREHHQWETLATLVKNMRGVHTIQCVSSGILTAVATSLRQLRKVVRQYALERTSYGRDLTTSAAGEYSFDIP